MLQLPKLSLSVAMVSLNPNCPAARRRSESLDIELARPVPVSGVEHIEAWIQNQSDQFKFSTTLDATGANKPDHRLIRSVTNKTVDIHGTGVDLELVRHQEVAGAQAQAATLLRDAPTAAFNGHTVTGDWSLRAINISAQLLDRNAIHLDVAWTRS